MNAPLWVKMDGWRVDAENQYADQAHGDAWIELQDNGDLRVRMHESDETVTVPAPVLRAMLEGLEKAKR